MTVTTHTRQADATSIRQAIREYRIDRIADNIQHSLGIRDAVILAIIDPTVTDIEFARLVDTPQCPESQNIMNEPSPSRSPTEASPTRRTHAGMPTSSPSTGTDSDTRNYSPPRATSTGHAATPIPPADSPTTPSTTSPHAHSQPSSSAHYAETSNGQQPRNKPPLRLPRHADILTS